MILFAMTCSNFPNFWPASEMLKNLKIKIFSDGADIESIKLFSANPFIKGFTTNPTLMRKAGVNDYEVFAKEAINFTKSKLKSEMSAQIMSKTSRMKDLLIPLTTNHFRSHILSSRI